jgi:hypothetical protein
LEKRKARHEQYQSLSYQPPAAKGKHELAAQGEQRRLSLFNIRRDNSVKWIAGSKHTGKDNFSWYRFDIRHTAGSVFHGREQDGLIQARRTRICDRCGKAYEPQRASSRFCSNACPQRAHHEKLSVTIGVTETLRYVAHGEVERFLAQGWEILPALDGTHHAEYGMLMRQRAPIGRQAIRQSRGPR